MLTVILAGGQSRRMGKDKARLPCGETTLLQMLIDRYSVLGPVAVSVDTPGRFGFSGALELPDRWPGMGPLNGLYSAFTSTDSDSVFLTATDLPNGDPALARVLADRRGDKAACVIRRDSGGFEPVFAVYSRACLGAVSRCMENARRSFIKLFQALDMTVLPEEQLASWRLDEVLLNMNTPEDYEKWMKTQS